MWNAEGPRPKIAELSSRLLELHADVIAVQEGQFPKAVPRIPGFQPPVVTRRIRGRRDGVPGKGGDFAIYVRDGHHFSVLSGFFQSAADDTAEICGVRILGTPDLDVINLYRTPVRQDETGERTDNFNPDLLPHGGNVIVKGDSNARHPLWDSHGDQADEVGEHVAAWLDRRRWTVLNDGPQPSPATAPEA